MSDLCSTLLEPFKYMTTGNYAFILLLISLVLSVIVVVKKFRNSSSLQTSLKLSFIPFFLGTAFTVRVFFITHGEVLECYSSEIYTLVSNTYFLTFTTFMNALFLTLLLTIISLLLYSKSLQIKHLFLPTLLILLSYGSYSVIQYFKELKYQRQYQNLPFHYMAIDRILFPELHPSRNYRIRDANSYIHIMLEPDGIWYRHRSFLQIEKELFTPDRTKEDFLNSFCDDWKLFYDVSLSRPPIPYHSYDFYPTSQFLVEAVPPLDTVSISRFHDLATYMGLHNLYILIGDTRYTCPTNKESLDSLYTVWKNML